MSTTWIIVALILGFIITFQIAKASEYVSILRGEEKTRRESNRINAFLLLVFLALGFIGIWACHEWLADRTLRMNAAASDHGEKIDMMMLITLWVTGIVFVITQVLLFWYGFKYQEKEGRKVYYFPHDNKLELIWTVIPAIVLTVLVGFGLYYWYNITGEAPQNAQLVEVTGKQFGWEYRYPGKDGVLGKKYYKYINEEKANPLGQIWEDKANHDDLYAAGEMHVVVGKPVKLVIYAKDVIHDVGLAHFRMKMDAVPGQPTTMWFTPKYTTAEMRKKHGENFNYEISCDQMCGRGHYTMRGTINVVTQAEFDAYISKQTPKYVEAMKQNQPAAPTTDTTKNMTASLNK